MKNIVLFFYLIFIASNTFGMSLERRVIFEKNGVLISYDYCNKYLTKGFGTPYCITIKNGTKKPICVSPSIVVGSLVSYKDIAEPRRNEYAGGAFSGALAALYIMALYKTGDRSVKESPCLTVTGVACLGSFSLFCLYKLLTEDKTTIENALKKEVLHEDIEIKPGQEVKKLFWLESRAYPIQVNLEAIKF